MDDDEFNTLKFKLPFLLKNNKDQFYFCVSLLTNRINNFTTVQLIDLFYTFRSLNISKIWISYLENIIDKLPIQYQMDIIKFSCSCSDEHVETMKILIDKVFDNISKDDKLILEFSFLDKKFFKPILSSELKSIRLINKQLSLYITEKCSVMINNDNIKLTCLEKIKQFRDLNISEIDYLKSLLSFPEYVGRILDIFLRIDDPCIRKHAYDILSKDKASNPLLDKNAVHFFQIKPDILEKMNGLNVDELLPEIEDCLDISRLMSNNVNNMYYIINLILSSNYTINSVSIEKIFMFLWKGCSFDHKKSFVEELSTYDISTCCYGIIINMLIYMGAIKNEEYLFINQTNEIEKIALEKLKEIHPADDNFWVDPTIVEKMLKETMSSIFATCS
jgi:hypothetical protein